MEIIFDSILPKFKFLTILMLLYIIRTVHIISPQQTDGSLSSIIIIFFQFRKQSNRVMLVTLGAGCSVATMFFFLICFTFILFSSLQSFNSEPPPPLSSSRPARTNPESVTPVAQSNRWNHTATIDFYLFIYYYYYYFLYPYYLQ